MNFNGCIFALSKNRKEYLTSLLFNIRQTIFQVSVFPSRLPKAKDRGQCTGNWN